ncbi:hypothetical protein P4O66_022106, partial [Electrophorus voltai]
PSSLQKDDEWVSVQASRPTDDGVLRKAAHPSAEPPRFGSDSDDAGLHRHGVMKDRVLHRSMRPSADHLKLSAWARTPLWFTHPTTRGRRGQAPERIRAAPSQSAILPYLLPHPKRLVHTTLRNKQEQSNDGEFSRVCRCSSTMAEDASLLLASAPVSPASPTQFAAFLLVVSNAAEILPPSGEKLHCKRAHGSDAKKGKLYSFA